MNFLNKILKLIILQHIIFISNQQITTGIYQIIEDIQYPIVFDANEEYYNVICATHYYVYHKENNNLRSDGSSGFDNISPLLLFQDPQNNYYVKTSNILYLITLNINKEITQINKVGDEITDFQIFGYITERMFSGYISISENIDFSLYEMITYGKEGNNLYFFYRIDYQLKNANLGIEEEIGDYLSCTMYQKDYFICAFKTEHYFKICLCFCHLNTVYVMNCFVK